MLPKWLQQIAADCTEQERKSLKVSIMHKTQVERTRRLRENNRAKGLKQVTVTIPESKASELKELAEKWRNNPINRGIFDE